MLCTSIVALTIFLKFSNTFVLDMLSQLTFYFFKRILIEHFISEKLLIGIPKTESLFEIR